MLTLFTLMDFPVHIDTISMDMSILYFKGHRSKFINVDIYILNYKRIPSFTFLGNSGKIIKK